MVPSMTEVEGSTLTMSVEINIRFEFEVKWYRNGTRITQSPGRFLIQQTFIDAMICSLTILELKLRDEGWGVSFKDVCWIFETFQKTKNKKQNKRNKNKKQKKTPQKQTKTKNQNYGHELTYHRNQIFFVFLPQQIGQLSYLTKIQMLRGVLILKASNGVQQNLF